MEFDIGQDLSKLQQEGSKRRARPGKGRPKVNAALRTEGRTEVGPGAHGAHAVPAEQPQTSAQAPPLFVPSPSAAQLSQAPQPSTSSRQPAADLLATRLPSARSKRTTDATVPANVAVAQLASASIHSAGITANAAPAAAAAAGPSAAPPIPPPPQDPEAGPAPSIARQPGQSQRPANRQRKRAKPGAPAEEAEDPPDAAEPASTPQPQRRPRKPARGGGAAASKRKAPAAAKPEPRVRKVARRPRKSQRLAAAEELVPFAEDSDAADEEHVSSDSGAEEDSAPSKPQQKRKRGPAKSKGKPRVKRRKKHDEPVNQYKEIMRQLLPARTGKRLKINPDEHLDQEKVTLDYFIRHANAVTKRTDDERAAAAKTAEAAAEKAVAAAAVPLALPAAAHSAKGAVASGAHKAQSSGDGDEAGPSAVPAGPRLVMRDGRIVVDESSLRVKAVAEVAAPLERVAEDTRPVNSLSYLPMSKLTKERWSEADTDKFYYALQTVGCDFTMIAKFFDGRTRKQVKNKYLKESSKNAERMTRAMAGDSKDVAGLRHMSTFLMSDAEPSASGVTPAKSSSAAAAGGSKREAAGETSPKRGGASGGGKQKKNTHDAGSEQGGVREWEVDEGVAVDDTMAQYFY